MEFSEGGARFPGETITSSSKPGVDSSRKQSSSSKSHPTADPGLTCLGLGRAGKGDGEGAGRGMMAAGDGRERGKKALTLIGFERIRNESSPCMRRRKDPGQLMLNSD